MKIFRFILGNTICILPALYALYTREWTPLLLALWGILGMFYTVIEMNEKKINN